MMCTRDYRHLCGEMTVAMTIVYQVVILGAIFATTNIQANEEVILYEVSNSGGCPGDTVTWSCTIYSSVLEWFCTSDVHRTIDCSANDAELMSKTCYDQTLTPKFHNCTSTPDGTIIITSIVDINTSLSDTTWICMNPRNTSLKKAITVSVRVPPAVTLTLNSTKRYDGDSNLGVAIVTWKEPTYVQYHNTTYNVTVEPAAKECYTSCVTPNQFVELVLAIGTEHNVTIITELCSGKLKTGKSEPLSILLKVPPSVPFCNATHYDDGRIEVYWGSLNDSLYSYYNLTYMNTSGNISSQVILPEKCCSYNITEKSANNVSIAAVNKMGSGEQKTCISSDMGTDFYPSNNNIFDKVPKGVLGLIIAVAVILPLLLVLCAVISQRWCNKKVQEQEDQFEETEEVLEPNPVQRSYEDVKAAFEASQHVTAESPIKMEAGRSVLYNNIMYFAAYGVDKIYRYSVDSGAWTYLGKKMKFFNPGLAIIDEEVATIGGVKKGKPTNEVWAWRKKQWVAHKRMKVKLSDPAVVMSPAYTYVVAISGNICIDVEARWSSSVQVYNVKQKCWKLVSSLPSPRAGAEVTLCNQTVYVFSDRYLKGYKCTLKNLISSIPNDKVWDSIQSFPLTFSTPTSVDGHVVCIGGGNEDAYGLDEIHIYDERTNSWNKVNKPLLKRRIYCMVETCNKMVVVVGGIDRVTNERDVSDRLITMEVFTLN